MRLTKVVLPAPFGPITPRISRSDRVKLTSFTATSPENRRVTLTTSSRALIGYSF